MPGTSIGDAIQWLQDNAKNTLPQGYNYDFKSEARQLVQEGNAPVSYTHLDVYKRQVI